MDEEKARKAALLSVMFAKTKPYNSAGELDYWVQKLKNEHAEVGRTDTCVCWLEQLNLLKMTCEPRRSGRLE